MNIWQALVNALKLPIKIVASLALGMSAFLLIPREWHDAMGTEQIYDDYRQWLVLALFVAVAVVAVELISFSWSALKEKRRERKVDAARRRISAQIDEHIRNLDRDEKAILREYYLAGNRTKKLPVTNPAVSSLVNKGVLEIVDRYRHPTIFGVLVNLSLDEKAAQLLTPRLLDIPADRPEDITDRMVSELRRLRPPFVENLDWLSKYL
jgi:hypothetical protein